ncbi:MAG: hypothetical protein KF838_04265 [Phycisphaeraceae bacterium]|nr:MAG: hypothetical protein KF838_04265 [Phycisphaeraceae bacterium]
MSSRVAIWAMPKQVELVRLVASGAGLEIACAGSPAKGQSGAVASELGAETLADLRSALAEKIADVVLIASAGDFGADPDRNDAELLGGAAGRGCRVVSFEPLPPSSILLSRGSWLEGARGLRPVDGYRWCPTLRHSHGWRQAPDALESFGRVRAASVESIGSGAEGTLGARLIGAIEVVCATLGVPESIDAAFVGATWPGSVHAIPGESLRDLEGSITANLRFADGRSASLIASSVGGLWRRAGTFVGEGGTLRISDDGVEWHRPDGTLQDRSRPRVDRPWSTPASEVVAEALARSVDPSIDSAPGPAGWMVDHATMLMVAQAALLSARTGQTESIETIRHMSGVE